MFKLTEFHKVMLSDIERIIERLSTAVIKYEGMRNSITTSVLADAILLYTTISMSDRDYKKFLPKDFREKIASYVSAEGNNINPIWILTNDELYTEFIHIWDSNSAYAMAVEALRRKIVSVNNIRDCHLPSVLNNIIKCLMVECNLAGLILMSRFTNYIAENILIDEDIDCYEIPCADNFDCSSTIEDVVIAYTKVNLDRFIYQLWTAKELPINPEWLKGSLYDLLDRLHENGDYSYSLLNVDLRSVEEASGLGSLRQMKGVQ